MTDSLVHSVIQHCPERELEVTLSGNLFFFMSSRSFYRRSVAFVRRFTYFRHSNLAERLRDAYPRNEDHLLGRPGRLEYLTFLSFHLNFLSFSVILSLLSPFP